MPTSANLPAQLTANQETPTTRKPKIIFVGAFAPAKRDGALGGQLTACRTLIESPISQRIDWLLIDSTQYSLPVPNWFRRGAMASQRSFMFARLVFSASSDGAFIYSSFRTASLLEKCLMALCATWLGKRVVISFVSEIFPKRGLIRQLVKSTVRSCAHVLCQSPQAAEALAEHFKAPREKLVVVPNWLELAAFHPKVGDVPARASSTFTLVYLGWLTKEKGLFDLLEALELVRASGLDVRLVLGGEGPQGEALTSAAAHRRIIEHVEFRGWITGAARAELLREGDALVLPTHSEGLPNVLLEAMAMQLPVIATNVGGIPSIVTHRREGLLVSPRDTRALSSAIAELAQNHDLCQEMGEAGRRRVERDHDIERLWPLVAELLIGQHVD